LLALTARSDAATDDVIADLELSHPFGDSRYDPCNLVAQQSWEWVTSVLRDKDPVTVTQSDSPDVDEDLSGSQVGQLHFGYVEAVQVGVLDQGSAHVLCSAHA
jgi:hypothetical protein